MARLLPAVQTPSRSHGTEIVIGGIVAAALGFFVVKPMYQKWEANRQLTNDQNSTIKGKPGKPVYNVQGKPVKEVNLATIVYDLQQGLHPGWYKTTDQDRVMRAFNAIPFGYVSQVEKMYLDKFSENLRQTLADKLSETNWIKIKYWFK